MERCLAPLADKIICISEAEKASALRNKVTGEEKLALIPNGIDVAKVVNSNAKQRSELGITEDAFVVGMIGRLSPQKAPDVFIRAASLIEESVPNAAFIIVGGGEERQETEEYARKHGLQLIVTGWTEEPYAYLKVFDVAVLLSRWEGFGLAVVEYMAAGKNVVATRTDAIPTLIDDGKDGLLVEVDNPEDVRKKVLWLRHHPKEAEDMRKRAYQKVVELYDINRVADQHAELFVNLCKQKRATCSLQVSLTSTLTSNASGRRLAA